jgi:glycosyltransferase involved in cell wall biosynthesis
MKLLGLIPEPPFAPKSWSGSSAFFFGDLKRKGLLQAAEHVQISSAAEKCFKIASLSYPVARWRDQYHANTSRFGALTKAAGSLIERRDDIDAVLQIGAWFSSGRATRLPCFSYHDGNAALWYRFDDKGMLSARRRADHLAWEKSVYSALTGIFVMSQWLADSFVRDFGMPEEKVHVVGAGMNFENLPVVPTRDFSVPRFLFVGRDFVRKGGYFLLEAFREVRRVVPSAELVIVGPDQMQEQDGVRFAGFVSKSDPQQAARLQQLFQESTALVLPSIYEPFGISLTEGMAYGLPCIAADRCAMPEIVEHEISGLVVPAENAERLADAMIQLARDPSASRKMGIRGRERVESDFTWEAVTRKIAATLTERYGI